MIFYKYEKNSFTLYSQASVCSDFVNHFSPSRSLQHELLHARTQLDILHAVFLTQCPSWLSQCALLYVLVLIVRL